MGPATEAQGHRHPPPQMPLLPVASLNLHPPHPMNEESHFPPPPGGPRLVRDAHQILGCGLSKRDAVVIDVTLALTLPGSPAKASACAAVQLFMAWCRDEAEVLPGASRCRGPAARGSQGGCPRIRAPPPPPPEPLSSMTKENQPPAADSTEPLTDTGQACPKSVAGPAAAKTASPNGPQAGQDSGRRRRDPGGPPFAPRVDSFKTMRRVQPLALPAAPPPRVGCPPMRSQQPPPPRRVSALALPAAPRARVRPRAPGSPPGACPPLRSQQPHPPGACPPSRSRQPPGRVSALALPAAPRVRVRPRVPALALPTLTPNTACAQANRSEAKKAGEA
nr:basic proline-rich protein-like [Loxodonta africana]